MITVVIVIRRIRSDPVRYLKWGSQGHVQTLHLAHAS